jgi:hypothetical protein
LLKPIDTNIIKQDEATIELLSKRRIIDDKFKEVKIGALEVQMCLKKNGKPNIILLHSKLRTKQWPVISNILEKILDNSPSAKLDIQCYEREKDYNNINAKAANEINKYNDIKVNIYKLKIPEINELTSSTREDLTFLCDPKKRKILLANTKAYLQQERPFENENKSLYNSTQNRPTTGKSSMMSGVRPTTPLANTQLKYVRPTSCRPQSGTRPLSSNKKSTNIRNVKDENIEIIEDLDTIDCKEYI